MSEISRPDVDAIWRGSSATSLKPPNCVLSARKFMAEQRKLIAESQKLDRERGLMPWQIVVTAAGAGAALFAAGAAFVKLLGP